ncbi:AAA family ATPase [Auraticoccus sp. F435]|uniref:AAA family ATPase n=1 Tax=Auraticoccus cholistanensis TaxID=2656650 RepID=A0A6A9UTH3_9ACTN|nr:AAA family ATPase [Auraticoccus cholistanensis]
MIPRTPLFDADSGGEEAVWRALVETLPDEAALFAGVELFSRGTEAEIDLLVAWPGRGIAVLEVKGGRIRRRDGEWLQGNTSGRVINPVRQANRTRHLLIDLLKTRDVAMAASRIVTMVAFPHTYLQGEWRGSLDLHPSMLLTRSELEGGTAAEQVERALWEAGGGRSPIDEQGRDDLIDIVDHAFPSHVEQVALAAEHTDHADRLTAEQARMLDVLAHQQRMRIVGGAGTGKTYLALQQARRRVDAGERVALLCYSRGLGRYLERMTAGWRRPPAYVGLFHDLPKRWGAEPGADDDPDYWERRLPLRLGELAETRPQEELFDSVVVDEAQDFGELWWPSLLKCLRDPERGGLFAFMDDAQRVFPRNGQVPIELAPFTLSGNLRSTRQIAQLFGSLAGSTTDPRGLNGPPVRLVEASVDEAIEVADEVVESLLDEGWEPGHVALLTTQRRHPAQVHDIEAVGHAAYWDNFFSGEDVFYGHVLGFKGLERPVVVLVVNGFKQPERAREMLYTGLSRARSLLVVVGPRELVETVGGDGVRHRLRSAETMTTGGGAA